MNLFLKFELDSWQCANKVPSSSCVILCDAGVVDSRLILQAQVLAVSLDYIELRCLFLRRTHSAAFADQMLRPVNKMQGLGKV